MEKRGLAGILVPVLLIALTLALVVVVWFIISSQLEAQKELTTVQSQLAVEKYTIKRFVFDPATGTISVIITRTQGEIYLESEEVIEKYADIVFVMDSSGSMQFAIDALKNTITSFVNELESREINARLGLVDFKDYPHETYGECGGVNDWPSQVYQFSGEDFTSDASAYITKLEDYVNATGGGDAPESHLTAIQEASNLAFNDNARKYIIAISDRRPHAIDCCVEYTGTPGATSYLDWSDLSQGDDCAVEGWRTTFNRNGCYTGPPSIKSLANDLAFKDIVFYYVGKDNVCSQADGRPSLKLYMTSLTGGSFYEFTSSGAPEIEGLISGLANEIVREYGSNAITDHLLLVVYGESGESQTFKLGNPPDLPFQAEEYIKQTDINPVVRIELYAIVVTSDGTEIRGPLLDEWFP